MPYGTVSYLIIRTSLAPIDLIPQDIRAREKRKDPKFDELSGYQRTEYKLRGGRDGRDDQGMGRERYAGRDGLCNFIHGIPTKGGMSRAVQSRWDERGSARITRTTIIMLKILTGVAVVTLPSR